jgi:hypothetical protein
MAGADSITHTSGAASVGAAVGSVASVGALVASAAVGTGVFVVSLLFSIFPQAHNANDKVMHKIKPHFFTEYLLQNIQISH